jgi:hypothetical protein
VGPRAGLDTEARRKILCPCRRSNPDRPVVQPVVLTVNSYYFFESVKQLTFVMVKYCVLFEIRDRFSNIILTSFGFNI